MATPAWAERGFTFRIESVMLCGGRAAKRNFLTS
jgi:hypothetical protein